MKRRPGAVDPAAAAFLGKCLALQPAQLVTDFLFAQLERFHTTPDAASDVVDHPAGVQVIEQAIRRSRASCYSGAAYLRLASQTSASRSSSGSHIG